MLKYDKFYMSVAIESSKLSYCERSKVGCVIIKDNRIISYGYNGNLPGYPNVCEDSGGSTIHTVCHAEFNAIAKIASSTDTTKGSTLYSTLSPCAQCAKLIIASGITRVVYMDEYRITDGTDLLVKSSIIVDKYSG